MGDFDSGIVEAIREALDMDDDETLAVVTPQFEREDGVEPGDPPLTPVELDRLKQADGSELRELGLRQWSDETGLWLLPYEWHPHVPQDYEFVSILNEPVTRAEKPPVPDKRFGVLSFGIIPEFEEADDG